MKKIMLVLIAVIMLFTACSKNVNPIEKYSNVHFGMTKDEVTKALGTPKIVDNEAGMSYEYANQKWFGLKGENSTQYIFNDDDLLYSIMVFYKMDNSEQYKTAYSAVKNEITNYYSESNVTENNNICSISENDFFAMIFYTENESANYGLAVHLEQKSLFTEPKTDTE